ncbi:NADH oxidase [Endozoicomonas sp. OPT23]|uniref:NADH:flavin oxidoreductase/NADH oxidase family protein n=1 Tax=Endozoicomonas sp. OPT23 TaxID=2072845 RepID=UPI00129A5B74|nr:NADH:flavin oxidoreductase/NADH oxidase family protein [Endozoicomonas sp. OPT23]MRI32000.1 NADH oxidase [Endozoicomonas sp. OPT23]
MSVELNSTLSLTNTVTLKNRFYKSAMSEQLADDDHNPTESLFKLYETWAEGGSAICVTGNLMIDRTAIAEPKNCVLDEQSDLDKYRQWARQGTKNNTQLWVQLNHPGKQVPSFISSEPVAPSAIPFEGDLGKGFKAPRAMTEFDILKTIQAFATSARLAKECGFNGVQIHSAHGYLVNQFLSPRHNQRDDQWGGNPENRRRFVLEVYKAVRAEVGDDYPVGIKLNSADFLKDGFSEEDSMAVVKVLTDAGINLIEVSGGTYEAAAMMGVGIKEGTKKREAYFLEYAEKVRQVSGTTLAVTGGFRSSKAMSSALSEGATDLIGIARPMTVEPSLPLKAMNDSNYKIEVNIRSTGSAILDQIGMLDLNWYEAQLARLGKGKLPNENLSGWSVLFHTVASIGRFAFKKRRA